MVKRKHTRHRYALSCLLSSLAGLMGFINPLLSGMLVARAKESFTVPNLLPIAACLAAVKLARMYFRTIISKFLGSTGSQRAPFIWLQHRLGKRLWWLEPALHNWGWVGMVMTRVFGKKSVSMQVASGIIYSVTDTFITVAAGFIYYFTDNYLLSFLSVLFLPSLIFIPWITARAAQKRDFDSTEPSRVRHGQTR